MIYEDQQKYTHGGTDGTGSCTTSGGRILPYQKPSQVYTTTIAGVPDYKRTSWPRLSRYPCYAQRMVGFASNPWLTSHSTFYYTLCCQQTTVKKPSAEAILRSILQQCRSVGLLKDLSKLVAIDSTGMETRHASRYYTRRCKRHHGHYKHRLPKLSAICDTSNHLLLGMVIDRGPKLDYAEDESTLLNALSQKKFETILGDVGYKSERFHKFCRKQSNIRSIIPTTQHSRPR